MYNSNLNEDQMIKFKYILKKDIGCLNTETYEEFQAEEDDTNPTAQVHIAVWAPDGSYYNLVTGEELDRTTIIPYSFVMLNDVILGYSEGKLNKAINGFPNNKNLDTYLLLFGYVGMDTFSEDYKIREYNFEGNLDYNCQYFVLSNSGRLYKGNTPMEALDYALKWDTFHRVNAFQALTRYRLTYRNKFINMEDAMESNEEITINEDYFALKDNSRYKPTTHDIKNPKTTNFNNLFFNKGIYVSNNIDGKITFDPTGSIIPSSVIFNIKYNKVNY